MAKVNVNDRTSLEQAYPADAFASDAAQNEVPSAVQHGARIGSAPDADGCFELERASRHAGEPETPNFLAPALAETQQPGGYSRFLDGIVAAAEQFGFRKEESPGRGDPRLRGLRQ
jgi:hypothetical protein